MIRIYRTSLTTNGVFSSSLAENTITEAELEQSRNPIISKCYYMYMHLFSHHYLNLF